MQPAVLVCLISTAGLCFAQGEHGRRAGAEVRVLVADLRKLTVVAEAGSDLLVQQGLQDRVRGSLAGMDILLRLADQESGRKAVSYLPLVHSSLANAEAGRWGEVMESWLRLEETFPLVPLPYLQSDALLQRGQKLHQQYCAACHDTPIQNVQRPAYNLYQQARSIKPDVFFARLLVGVRGDPMTGIDNPLSDADIAALTYWYKAGPHQ